MDPNKSALEHLTGGRLNEEEMADLNIYVKRFANSAKINELENVTKLKTISEVTKKSVMFRINQLKKQFQSSKEQ